MKKYLLLILLLLSSISFCSLKVDGRLMLDGQSLDFKFICKENECVLCNKDKLIIEFQGNPKDDTCIVNFRIFEIDSAGCGHLISAPILLCKWGEVAQLALGEKTKNEIIKSLNLEVIVQQN